jgi:hypothetical protein
VGVADELFGMVADELLVDGKHGFLLGVDARLWWVWAR